MLARSLAILALAAAPAAAAKPKNVVLFIGDGMGLVQSSSAAIALLGTDLDAQGEPPKLSFEKFPVFGLQTTWSSDALVTDSASAATAMASGVKTDNRYIGVDAKTRKVTNLAMDAKASGRATAVATSVPMDHATPAAFFAHVDHREKYDQIMDQYFADADYLDVLLGGGAKAQRYAGTGLAAAAKAKGISYIDAAGLKTAKAADFAGKRVLGNFDANGNTMLDFMSERGPDCPDPELSDVALFALDLVDDAKGGFFLMVEGGAIDWGGHGNDPNHAIGEAIEFHDTIEKVVAALEKSGQLADTLIVVTADHETGGMAINGPQTEPHQVGKPIEISWTTKKHTGVPVPVYARGPMSERFAGKHDNTNIHRVLQEAMKP